MGGYKNFFQAVTVTATNTGSCERFDQLGLRIYSEVRQARSRKGRGGGYGYGSLSGVPSLRMIKEKTERGTSGLRSGKKVKEREGQASRDCLEPEFDCGNRKRIDFEL